MRIYRSRNVRPPSGGGNGNAGIDFYVPEFDEVFINDLKNKNIDLELSDYIIILYPHTRILIPSGIYVNFSEWSSYALIAHNKSGVASKKGLDILAEVIDESYQGEVHLNIVNTSSEIQYIEEGEKLIQFILTKIAYPKIKEVSSLEELYPAQTERGAGGFGSTDKNGMEFLPVSGSGVGHWREKR